MQYQLDEAELRVLASLMEKSLLTPDVYPMTLNALALACNQKSSRDPVLSLEPGAIGAALRRLEALHLVKREENPRTGIERYAQRLSGTPYAAIRLDAAEFAVLCVLMLRGAQTPGELRTRCARLHEFPDSEAVRKTLERLIARDGGALAARLPLTPGRHDHTYAHCLSGPLASVAPRSPGNDAPAADASAMARAGTVEAETGSAGDGAAARSTGMPRPDGTIDVLTARIERLEALVTRMEQRMQALEGRAAGGDATAPDAR
jgi:hypothetical protein